jgi:hypothetical protein
MKTHRGGAGTRSYAFAAAYAVTKADTIGGTPWP